MIKQKKNLMAEAETTMWSFLQFAVPFGFSYRGMGAGFADGGLAAGLTDTEKTIDQHSRPCNTLSEVGGLADLRSAGESVQMAKKKKVSRQIQMAACLASVRIPTCYPCGRQLDRSSRKKSRHRRCLHLLLLSDPTFHFLFPLLLSIQAGVRIA